MFRSITLALILVGGTAGGALAGSFERTAIAPEHGVGRFDLETAREAMGKDLFGTPYAGIVLARVDLYDTFPYLEARYFQIVSDPGWNRILVGESGGALRAFDGRGTEIGPLSEPRGLTHSTSGSVYLADTGNGRIIEFRTSSEFSEMTLEPVRIIEDLARPFDVAFSDNGTPDRPDDDRLYVAEAGRNRIVAFALDENAPRIVDAVGELGSGPGFFAGPLALTVGRNEAGDTRDVYVADAHTRRLVHLVDFGDRLEWAGEQNHDLTAVTGLETDVWGNLYVTGPNQSRVSKYTADLSPLASLDTGIERPRAFHPVLANVTDHRTGESYRAGRGVGLLIEDWSKRSGFSLWTLGVEVNRLDAELEGGVRARFQLTDPASVTLRIRDEKGAVVSVRAPEMLGAGEQDVSWPDALAGLDPGRYDLEVGARSTYDQNLGDVATTTFTHGDPTVVAPVALLGNRPNPFFGSTRIRFRVPDGGDPQARLEIFDLRGRLVCRLLEGAPGGELEVTWDGRDNGGQPVGGGVYLMRLKTEAGTFTGKMVLIR